MKAIVVTMSDTRHEQKLVEVAKTFKTRFVTSDGTRFNPRTKKALSKQTPLPGEHWCKTIAILEGTPEYRERMASHEASNPGGYWHINGAPTSTQAAAA